MITMIINYYDYCNNYCFRHDCYDYYYYYRHAYYDSYYICNTYTSVGSLHACRYLWAQWLRTYGCMLCSHPFVCPVAQIPPQLRSPRSCGPAVPRSHGPAAMADREVAWRALEALFGSEVRGPGSRPYKFNVVRVCGLSDRLTGSWGSQRICRLQRHFFGSRSVRHSGSFFQGPLPEF